LRAESFRHPLRLIRTLRYLRTSQIVWRARCVLRRRFGGLPVPNTAAPAAPWDAASMEILRTLQETMRDAGCIGPTDLDALRSGSVEFLNQGASITEGIPWHDPRHGRLWQYNLHYGRFIRDGVIARVVSPEQARTWLEDWVARNPPGTDVAWDPFCVAARLINWPLALAELDDPGEVLRNSYARQAAFLRANLEWDVQANHLHKNAAALVIAESVTGGAPSPIALRLLEGQLREQINPDGGHYERSLMYHQHVLEDTLIARIIAGESAATLDDTLVSMTHYLADMLHEDGEIPRFGDAVGGDAPPPVTLIHLAHSTLEISGDSNVRATSRAFPDTGYYWLGHADRMRCIVSAGEPSPPWQPGHAHADALSYEIACGNRRFVVDTGVHGYADSPWRAHCRGTVAHNVTRPRGAEQLELWGAFRVGRRYTMNVETWDTSGNVQTLVASHDGYPAARVRRCVQYHPQGVILITDTVEGDFTPDLESFIHLHPHVAIKPEDRAFVLRNGAESLVLLLDAGTEVRLAAGIEGDPLGYHFPAFGVTENTHCIVMTKQAERLRYAWVRCDSVHHARDLLRAAFKDDLGAHES
jgi:uncharacterized heparinase superfamily protein